MGDALPRDADRAPAERLTLDGVRRGFLVNTYLALFVVPWGLAFGAAAIERGLDAATVVAISAFMFAGASQFAALELWDQPLPILMLVLTVFAVNARHIVMGATLAPWALAVPPVQRYGALAVLTDVNWAYATTRYRQGERDFGVLVGSGVLLWIAWTSGTIAGVLVGSQLGNPKAYGLDVLMVAFFAAMLAPQLKSSGDLVPWAVAGAVGVGGLYLLPKGWNVIAGAIAGGIAGVVMTEMRGGARAPAEPMPVERKP